MKKLYTCILVVVLSVSMIFTGCGNDKTKETGNNGNSQTENAEQNNEQQSNAPNIQGKPVSQCFDSITGVSQEWKDGLYVVNGEDKNGQMICGIMDKNGNVEIFDGYTALYPLADGHLIATTDTEVCGDCNFYGKSMTNKEVGIPGVIIDENKNIIYEPDESQGYERMYQINSKKILAIQAKKGFDEIEIRTRLIDQNGKDISDDEVIDSSFFTSTMSVSYKGNSYSYDSSSILFDDDGIKWHLSVFIVSRNNSDEMGENISLAFIPEYTTGLNLKCRFGDNGEMHIQRVTSEINNDGITEGNFDSQTTYKDPSWTFSRFGGTSPEFPEIQKLQNSLSKDDDLRYIGKLDVTDDKTARFICRYDYGKDYEYRVYDTEGNELPLPEKYLGEKLKSYSIMDGKIFLSMDSNNQLFGAIINGDGTVYKEAFMLDNDSEIINLENDILKYRVDNKIYDFDVQQEKNIKEIPIAGALENGAEISNVEVIDNFIIVEYKKTVSSEVKDYFYEIYDLDGNKIS